MNILEIDSIQRGHWHEDQFSATLIVYDDAEQQFQI